MYLTSLIKVIILIIIIIIIIIIITITITIIVVIINYFIIISSICYKKAQGTTYLFGEKYVYKTFCNSSCSCPWDFIQPLKEQLWLGTFHQGVV